MISAHQKRIKVVKTFFDNKDTVLGFRKLMDCAIDSQDLAIYNEVIALTDWKTKHPDQKEVFIEKSMILLDRIANIPITEYDRSNPVVIGENLTKSYGENRFKLGLFP